VRLSRSALISPREHVDEETLNFARFLQIAAGSASEVEYHLLLSRDLELLQIADFQRLTEEVVEVKRMLAALM
jgi:four helix bundle protein